MTQWNEEKNKRRCELEDKDIDGTITLEEYRELGDLDHEFHLHRRIVNRLPIEEARLTLLCAYMTVVRKELRLLSEHRDGPNYKRAKNLANDLYHEINACQYQLTKNNLEAKLSK